jgi:hypothetical protein
MRSAEILKKYLAGEMVEPRKHFGIDFFADPCQNGSRPSMSTHEKFFREDQEL